MAAPSTTVRTTPGGKPLEGGHGAKIAFALDSDVTFWEKSTTPPAIDGGEPIDITTHFNTTWRTFAPRELSTLAPFDVVASYDPDLYDEALSLINQNGSITVYFPDGSKLDFYGYLQKMVPNALVEGEHPEVTLTIVPTNWDSTNDVEVGPVMTEVTGT